MELSGSVKAYFALKLTAMILMPLTCAAPAKSFGQTAAPPSATASPSSISRSSDSFLTPTARRCRRNWCCCRTGFISISTPCRAGRAPSSCLSASSQLSSQCVKCLRHVASVNFSSRRQRRQCCPRPRSTPVQLGQFLSRRRCALQKGGALGPSASHPQNRRGQGGGVDARTLHRQRRPRRHLPADDLYRCQSSLPRRRRRRPRNASRR